MDRPLYADHALTDATRPKPKRLLVRLLAFALNVPGTPTAAPLQFAPVGPTRARLWQHDPVGPSWCTVDRGRPARRAPPGSKACARAEHVIYCYGSAERLVGRHPQQADAPGQP